MGSTFINLNAKELLNTHADHGADVQQTFALSPLAEQAFDQVHFQATHLTIGNDQKVAATASRVEDANHGQLVVERLQLGTAGTSRIQLIAQVIHEKWIDSPQDVALRGVVSPKLATLGPLLFFLYLVGVLLFGRFLILIRLVQHSLEHCAEDCRRDLRPVQANTLKQQFPKGAVESGDA